MDQSNDLSREYDPTWGVDDWKGRLAEWRRAAQEARATLAHTADIRYGPRPGQLLDVFPAGDGAAAVVFIHGGYWQALSKSVVAGVASSLVPAGIASVHVGYDLCPRVSIGDIVDEIADALSWCGGHLSGFGIDPTRLVVAGSSAGAHLAAMAASHTGTSPHPVAGAFLSSGLYDLTPLVALPVNEVLGLDMASAEALSPINAPPPAGLDMVIQVGAAESAAWRDQSRRYAKACRAAGAVVESREIPHAHHFAIGLGIPGSEAARALVTAVRRWTAVGAPAEV